MTINMEVLFIIQILHCAFCVCLRKQKNSLELLAECYSLQHDFLKQLLKEMSVEFWRAQSLKSLSCT